MTAAGIVNYATDLDNSNFAHVARAIGLHGVRVERPDHLEAAPRDAFVHDGPAVIDIVTVRQKQLTFEQIKGFTLYASRTILFPRAVEIVEPAKTNLRDLGVE